MQIPKDKKQKYVKAAFNVIKELPAIDISGSELSDVYEKNINTLCQDIMREDFFEILKDDYDNYMKLKGHVNVLLQEKGIPVPDLVTEDTGTNYEEIRGGEKSVK